MYILYNIAGGWENLAQHMDDDGNVDFDAAYEAVVEEAIQDNDVGADQEEN